jgi:hypothetical protein
MLYYRQSRWPECFAMSMRALQITDRQLVYTCDPEVWGHWPHDLLSIAAWHLKLFDISLEHALLAVELSPNDERLQGNLKMIQGDLEASKNEAAQWTHSSSSMQLSE